MLQLIIIILFISIECRRVPAGDEVLEWNGRALSGKSFEEVYDIIAESRHEAQVELIVCRQLTDTGRHQPARRHTHAGLACRGD